MVNNPFSGISSSPSSFSAFVAGKNKSEDILEPIDDSEGMRLREGEWEVEDSKESVIRRLGDILKLHNFIESDIPLNHEYWKLKNKV